MAVYLEERDTNFRSVLRKLSVSGLRLRKEVFVWAVCSNLLRVRVSCVCRRPTGAGQLCQGHCRHECLHKCYGVTALCGLDYVCTTYNQFLPHLSAVLKPLHMLLCKDQPLVRGSLRRLLSTW